MIRIFLKTIVLLASLPSFAFEGKTLDYCSLEALGVTVTTGSFPGKSNVDGRSHDIAKDLAKSRALSKCGMAGFQKCTVTSSNSQSWYTDNGRNDGYWRVTKRWTIGYATASGTKRISLPVEKICENMIVCLFELSKSDPSAYQELKVFYNDLCKD